MSFQRRRCLARNLRPSFFPEPDKCVAAHPPPRSLVTHCSNEPDGIRGGGSQGAQFRLTSAASRILYVSVHFFFQSHSRISRPRLVLGAAITSNYAFAIASSGERREARQFGAKLVHLRGCISPHHFWYEYPWPVLYSAQVARVHVTCSSW